ncbi:hypothetical protein NDU88_004620 [Pleurodeles waltl]|uniref:Uncharacterized protein n=1 Tax=Pleurodeles waltl TaxID=8319 RepID=A0AAV7WSE3_PLEWA|nr:hypothetical protein NDU88_004620 [Pleurodeles waltl]
MSGASLGSPLQRSSPALREESEAALVGFVSPPDTAPQLSGSPSLGAHNSVPPPNWKGAVLSLAWVAGAGNLRLSPLLPGSSAEAPLDQPRSWRCFLPR